MPSTPPQVYEEGKPAVGRHQGHGPHDDRGSRPTTGLQESEYDVKAMTPEGGTYENTIFTATQFCNLGLPVAITDALFCMNYKRPSKVQATVLPLILPPKTMNLICQSQTGTGKTAAFSIAMIMCVDPSISSTQALCLSPTRELARQIVGHTQQISQFIGEVETSLAVPGTLARHTSIAAHIVVGTPGTVLDALRRGKINTAQIKLLVMDEADFLLDLQGLGDQAMRVKRVLPPNIQVLLFSATFTQKVLSYAAGFAPNSAKITLQRHQLTMSGIKQIYMDCQNEMDKYHVLVQLYHTMEIASSIIFVRMRVTADKIAAQMRADGHVVGVLHSALEGSRARDVVIDDFRDGKCKVLITTNVLARGLDVATTSMVVNYDLPRLADDSPDYVTYLHRIGRTGRFGRLGVSVSFVHDRRSWLELKNIQQYFGVPIHLVPADDMDLIEELIHRIKRSNREFDERAIGDVDQSRHADGKTG